MDQKLKSLILLLCAKVEEVIGNGDWPTEDGKWIDTGTACTCPINDLTQAIRKGLSNG